jgi:AraC-like DNA-binding protein
VRVELHRVDGDNQRYENFFACPVKFGARHNRLFFRAEDLDQPFITHNPDLLELIAPQLEADLKQHLAGRSLRDQVKGILKRRLAGQPPRLEDIAIELRMSARTLQRKLLEEGVTFHALMEEARREMAQHYLRQPSFELNETAYLLGYEDPNSFIRAFHRWEGTAALSRECAINFRQVALWRAWCSRTLSRDPLLAISFLRAPAPNTKRNCAS